MTYNEVTDQFLYSLFSNVYYEHTQPQYGSNECGTTEAVQCLLKSFYQRKVNRHLLEPKIVILSFGRIVHLALQDKLFKHGYHVEVEKPVVYDKFTLYTHTDALHDTHILEIKTCSSIPHQILQHHFLQANTYAVAHNKPVGYVAYIHKPSGIIKTLWFQPQTQAYQYVLLRAYRLTACLKTNTCPEPEPSWLCRYCEYVDLCPNPQRSFGRKGGT
jgi:CRISPR/Cas system-associated exonuclease Cas4 (RecB family)